MIRNIYLRRSVLVLLMPFLYTLVIPICTIYTEIKDLKLCRTIKENNRDLIQMFKDSWYGH